ncbi:MAG: hypothetical protein IKN59_05565, partial [Paludibacteraceae bacterium]|nr:hypothetical protein [Paludibacteraceae bacterium]
SSLNGCIPVFYNLGTCPVNLRHHIALQIIQIPVRCSVEDNDRRFLLRIIVEMQRVCSAGQMHDILPVKHVIGNSTSPEFSPCTIQSQWPS